MYTSLATNDHKNGSMFLYHSIYRHAHMHKNQKHPYCAPTATQHTHAHAHSPTHENAPALGHSHTRHLSVSCWPMHTKNLGEFSLPLRSFMSSRFRLPSVLKSDALGLWVLVLCHKIGDVFVICISMIVDAHENDSHSVCGLAVQQGKCEPCILFSFSADVLIGAATYICMLSGKHRKCHPLSPFCARLSSPLFERTSFRYPRADHASSAAHFTGGTFCTRVLIST